MIVFDINSRNIYHRDLKPENFLIKKDKNGNINLHLIDFFYAKSSIYDENYIYRITSEGYSNDWLYYMAPEIINDTTDREDMTKQDVWAIGIIAY